MFKKFFNSEPKIEKNNEDNKSKIQVNEALKDNKKESLVIEPIEKKEDFDTTQSISMGLDMKSEVEKYSKAFFNSKNELKASSYSKFESFLETLAFEKKRELQNMTYLEFKDKENQINNILKNGFSQFLSKGAHLDEETRQTIDMVFSDIKKLSSKGHRYWYYKIYMWQKRDS